MIKEAGGGVVFRARVKTGCSAFRVLRDYNSVIIECRSPPHKNMANLEIIKELSRIFGNAEILRGKSGRNKLILLRGVTPEHLKSLLPRQLHKYPE